MLLLLVSLLTHVSIMISGLTKCSLDQQSNSDSDPKYFLKYPSQMFRFLKKHNSWNRGIYIFSQSGRLNMSCPIIVNMIKLD